MSSLRKILLFFSIQWFKFDDDIVGRVAPSDAMERNFGGNRDDDYGTFNTSAYMLVYIREDCQGKR